jgi:iron complex transport system ATP-binding protein
MTARLAGQGLSFAYGAREVVRAIDVAAVSGELLGVLGPNGSGKTTLVRLLAGYLRPHAGTVLLDGKPVTGQARRALARRIAMVPQETPTDFPFTVAELVLMGRTSHLGPLGFESAADLAAADAAMAACDVRSLAERPIHALSGGELRRAYVARALAQGADTLLCDEPTSGLDLRHQLAIFELLRSQARAGRCVIVVVHDLNLAEAFCDRLLLLHEGAAIAAGAPQEVLTAEHVRAAYAVEVTRAPALLPVALATPERSR